MVKSYLQVVSGKCGTRVKGCTAPLYTCDITNKVTFKGLNQTSFSTKKTGFPWAIFPVFWHFLHRRCFWKLYYFICQSTTLNPKYVLIGFSGSAARGKYLKLINNQLSYHIRSSHRRCSVKKGVPKNFANVTGKDLCLSPFLIRPPLGLQLC